MKILVADDDKDIRQIIKVYLTGENYEIIEAEDGKQALAFMSDDISLVILDIMMPEMDGMEVCSKIREHYQMPILFLTAKSEDMDKISGLTVGADDYITKPFNPMELVARVKSNLRRYTQYEKAVTNSTESNAKIDLGAVTIDVNAHTVTKEGALVALTKTEFGILELFATHRGRVFSLEQIYENVWGEDSILNAENTVSVHIKRLREKIEDNIKKPQIVKTVWGVGYRVD